MERKKSNLEQIVTESAKRFTETSVSQSDLMLTPEERFAMYDSIIECLESGDSNENIAKNVIECVQEKLFELEKDDSFKTEKGKVKSPIFRRID